MFYMVYRLKCIAYCFDAVTLVFHILLKCNPLHVCRRQPRNWSGVTESSTAGITTTQCEAYRLTKRGQEREVVSEPEYDAIPTFEGKQAEGRQKMEEA